MHEFIRRVSLPASTAEAFAWHECPGAFDRLNAPWEPVRVLAASGGIRDGGRVAIEIPGPPPIRWTLRHEGYVAGERFRDVQESGPFAAWTHEHRFLPEGAGCVLEDAIRYALPMGPLGDVAAPWVEARLRRLFAWRHRVTAAELGFGRELALPRRRILLSGASGLIGRALASFLATQGHEVVRLVRRPPRDAGEQTWDPARGTLDPAAFEGVHAVIHLGGEGIADRRWSAARKRVLIESRVASTSLLARTIASLADRPGVFVSASATGIHGDRGELMLDERSAPGSGFLADLAREWEAAARPAAEAGVRVAHPRLGLVLTPLGGALAPLLRATRWGAGGPLGSGKQWWSWVTLDDVTRVMLFAVAREAIVGPFEVVTAAVRQRELASTLGRVLGRPSLTAAPAFALRLLLGEMAGEMLLASQRVRPAALERAGYRPLDPELEPALRAMLGRA